MTAFFISDLHLDESTPEATQYLIDFLQNRCLAQATHLIILGDFFEVWLGDDVIEPWHQPIIKALKTVSDSGIKTYFMQGNRDFLLGKRFCQQAGLTLLEDPTLMRLNDQQVLLMHGDLLCTDDVDYQRFRRLVRRPLVQRVFHCLPKRWRQRLAATARAKSKAHTGATKAAIMDVNTDTVNDYIQQYQPDILIHGHTHRPVVERRQHPQGEFGRIVLGAWHQQASILVWPADATPTLESHALKTTLS